LYKVLSDGFSGGLVGYFGGSLGFRVNPGMVIYYFMGIITLVIYFVKNFIFWSKMDISCDIYSRG